MAAPASTKPKRLKTGNISSLERRNHCGILFCLPFVIVFLIFSVYPVFRTLQMSFMNYKGFGKETFIWFDNYKRAFGDKLFWSAFVNTLKMWGVNIVLQLGLALLLTIIFNDIKYRMKGLSIFRALFYLPNLIACTSVAFLFKTLLDWVIFTVLLVFMMVPAQLSLLGFYNLVNQMGLIDTYWPLILPSIASPATVFFLRQYILSVMPKAILEAPRIDGAGELAIFHRIALPIMAPGIATMAIGAFIGSWNSYLIPMMLINTPAKRPLPVMVAELSAVRDITTNLGATYLVVAISAVPIMIAFCFFSRYIISGISAGSVKE